ncbi:hypothetical protein OEZ85_011737 [Tetradesmus obliquus]|uniref:ribonuclease Z n=1 Tax=Tetradesmus obliquus TaxID=3088 RepID=A0ABY8TRB1_TETOB|nr:hypothetical protein OEZ85_011737 [Tetradesmus obliquus]
MAPKNAQKKAHYSSHLQVFNVDNSTASPSVLLVLDNKRYLFNAGEGIQRHFIEYKQKMRQITSVLATRVSTDTLAGLPGMLLSQVSVGSDGTGSDAIKSSVYGPEGLSQYVRAFRNYASSFQLEQHEIGCKTKNPLSSIPGKFNPKKAAELGVPRGPMLGELQRGIAVTIPNGKVIQPHEVMDTPATPGACLLLVDCPSAAYLPGLQQQQQLLALQQEAAQLQLQQAPDVVDAFGSSSGDSEQVAPTKKFIVIHLGPADVTNSEPYKSWVAGFGPAVQHLMVSSDSQRSPTVLRAAVLQAQLNAIEPEVFSLQGFQALIQQQQQDATDTAGSQKQQQQSNVLAAGNGCRFTLAPLKHQGLMLEAVTAAPDLQQVQAEVRDSKRAALLQMLQDYQAAKAQVQQQPTPQQLQGISRRAAELTLLGTCSACPSNHRNVSAYYLDLFDRGGLLMDCGEDTMGQLERRFGRQQAAQRILGLNAIWVSHMHADHHGGLYPLLLRRQQLQQQQQQLQQQQQQQQPQPLLIMGPWPLFRVLSNYGDALGLQFRFLPNTYFSAARSPHEPPAAALAAYKAAREAAGLSVMEPFPVQHVAHSTGLRLESKDGWKVVFSGDTRPCQAVIDAARGATLLVHEATFEDELQDEAIAKKHSTTAEALGVAAAAGAYRTVLTHFSTRYPKIPVMKPPAAADGAAAGSDLAAVGSVVVGFDLMSINLADLAWLPKALPVLDELFQEEEAAYQQDDEAPPADA